MPTNYEPLVLTIEPAYVGSAVSPTVDITETSDDVTVTITDFRGEHSYTVEKTDGAIADAETAAANANSAASTAEAKGQQAVDIAQAAAASATATARAAADNANAKAALADTAATTANTAAGNADNATSAALAAKVDTEAATTAANTATNNANAATSTANTAAQNADAKAALANTAASNADAKAAQANTAAANADAKATLADNAAASATSAASDASTAASAANDAATAATNAANAADAAREAIQDDLAAKADKYGYYPLLSAGTSDALLSCDSTAGTFARRVSDHDGGVRIESLRGNTVRWNQLAPNVTISSSTSSYALTSGTRINNGSKYLLRFDADITEAGTNNPVLWLYYNDINGTPKNASVNANASIIFTASADSVSNGTTQNVAGNTWLYRQLNGATFTGKAQIFDLTRMFGAGNEPATVAEFESLFPESYYPYNAGELVSVNVEGVKAVGFNRFDGNNTTPGKAIRTVDGQLASVAVCSASDYIECLPNTGYCTPESIGSLVYGVAFYDGSKQFISGSGQNAVNKIHTSPANARYLRFTILTANIDTTCINISNPALNGTYRPYTEQTREIPASTYFPTGMRSAGAAYDELRKDKAVTRIGSRAYQSGDESNTSVITDGTTTYYALSTAVVVDIDPPLNMTYPTEQGGTESIVVPTGEQSAPPTLVTVYAYDADGIVDKSQSIVAPVEGARASANYSVGSYLVQSGTLYRVTTAIATGEVINPGSNVTATTVMAEIIRLTA